MSFNQDSQKFTNQVVITDTTNAGSTSGSLVVQGGVSAKDTYVTGHVAVNNVKITPNLNDIIYELQATLTADSAAKPSTNTWTVSSDSRLKTNITQANLQMCYDIIKNIPLKRYTWLDEVYTEEQVSDRSKLGWIAQDVEGYLPKSVEQKEMHGYSDCRTLNSD